MMHTRTNAPGAWFNKMLLLALLIAPFALASSSGLDLSGQAHAPFHFKRQINGTIAPTCPDGNGTTYISNGQNFTIECGFDRAAGPLNSIGSAGASDGVVDLQTCIDKCAATAECVDVSYVEGGGSCYLKSDVAWANYADNIFGARLTAQPYNQTLICPASNGTTFDTTAGYPYIVECSIDRSTGYITTANTVGLDDCLARCDITPGCIDVSWDPDTPTGTCYLKKAIDNPKTNTGIWGARFIGTRPATTSSSSSNAVQTATSSMATTGSTVPTSTAPPAPAAYNTSAVLTCPDSNGTLYSTYYNETFVVECYLDRPGNFLSPSASNFTYCIDLCALTQGCVDVSYSGSACYMKKSVVSVPASQSDPGILGARWANATIVAQAPVGPDYPWSASPVATPVPYASFTAIPYTVAETMNASDFFDHFTFNTDGDPTWGTVQYINRQTAIKYGMISSFSDHVTWKVDTIQVIQPGAGVNRKSLRLVSNNNYTQGLFVLDLSHMPFGCGTWPAFWSVGTNWPMNGEIDIIEGVNTNAFNSLSLHAQGDSCYVTGLGTLSNETFNDNTCSYDGGDTKGCGFADLDPQSYGAGLNAAGGGVYAMEWTSDWIRMWFFNRTNIPESITSGTPEPSQFGTPRANFQFIVDDVPDSNNSVCTVDQMFNNHQIVFDVTLCGQWAGAAYAQYAACPNDTPDNGWTGCNNYILQYPGNLTEAYWNVNSLKVYQRNGAPNTTFNQAPPLSVGTDAALTSSVGCPAYNDTTFIYEGLRYRLLCDYDDPSQSTSVPAMSSFQACVDACTTAQNCLSFSWVPTQHGCYLKTDLNSPESGNPGTWLAQLYDLAISPSSPIAGYSTYNPFTAASTTTSSTTSSMAGGSASASSQRSSTSSKASQSISGTATTTRSSSKTVAGPTTSSKPSSTTSTNHSTTPPTLSSSVSSSPTSLPPAYTFTTTSTTFSPLPTSTGTPACDTVFLNSDNTTYRIYCNATITGNTLLTQPLSNFPACITLCDGYNSTCIASKFTNSTTPSCQLIGNGTASGLSKRDGGTLTYQAQVFVAYHLVNATKDQGPPAPVPAVANGGLGTSRIYSNTGPTMGSLRASTSSMSSGVGSGPTSNGGGGGNSGSVSGSSSTGAFGTAGSGSSGVSGTGGFSDQDGGAGGGNGMCPAPKTVVVRVDSTHTHYRFPAETVMAPMAKGGHRSA